MFINSAHWNLQKHYKGNDQDKIIVIDNFFINPQEVVRQFNESIFDLPQRLYPGIRADISEVLMKEFRESLSSLLLEEFNCVPIKHSIWFSKVTTKESDLKISQILPHVDTFGDHDVAFVVYLFEENFGGTSFYRHKSTGYEKLTQNTFMKYTGILNKEIAASDIHESKYMLESNHLFEKIYVSQSKFNRCVLYKQNNLHNPDIFSIQNDRKTITGFIKGK